MVEPNMAVRSKTLSSEASLMLIADPVLAPMVWTLLIRE